VHNRVIVVVVFVVFVVFVVVVVVVNRVVVSLCDRLGMLVLVLLWGTVLLLWGTVLLLWSTVLLLWSTVLIVVVGAVVLFHFQCGSRSRSCKESNAEEGSHSCG